MSIFVKICGMTDEVAVAAAIEAGADALGFVFYEKSPRNLSIDNAARLGRLIPAGVAKIAVTLHPQAHLWDDIQASLQPDALQTDIDDFAYLRVDAGIEKWPVVREGSDPHQMPEQFVYEGRASGRGQKVDWKVAAGFARQGRMILAGGLNAANVGEALITVRPYGVDVSSAVESAPGVKDPGRIRDFIDAAKAAGQSRGNQA